MREKNIIREGASPSIRRVYFHHKDLEEYESGSGMWRIVSAGPDRERFLTASAALMADPDAFRDGMRLALKRWPNSCMNAFTTQGMNQRAWLGHAGCYLATGSPEETTRLGWHTLDADQQIASDAAADDVIAEWRAEALFIHTLQFDLFDILAGEDA